MSPKEYLAVLHCIAGLKERTRHAWMKTGRQESVAEHSWRMALMAYFRAINSPPSISHAFSSWRSCMIWAKSLGDILDV